MGLLAEEVAPASMRSMSMRSMSMRSLSKSARHNLSAHILNMESVQIFIRKICTHSAFPKPHEHRAENHGHEECPVL